MKNPAERPILNAALDGQGHPMRVGWPCLLKMASLHRSCHDALPLGARGVDGEDAKPVRARWQTQAGTERRAGRFCVLLHTVNPDLHAGEGAGNLGRRAYTHR